MPCDGSQWACQRLAMPSSTSASASTSTSTSKRHTAYINYYSTDDADGRGKGPWELGSLGGLANVCYVCRTVVSYRCEAWHRRSPSLSRKACFAQAARPARMPARDVLECAHSWLRRLVEPFRVPSVHSISIGCVGGSDEGVLVCILRYRHPYTPLLTTPSRLSRTAFQTTSSFILAVSVDIVESRLNYGPSVIHPHRFGRDDYQ